MRERNIFSRGLLILILFVAIDYLPLMAQKESQTKVTIIKETYDEHGNKTVQKIIKEGADADAIDLDKLQEGNNPMERSFDFKSFGDFGDLQGFENFMPFDGQGFDQFRSFFDSLGFGTFKFFGDSLNSENWMPFDNSDSYTVKPKLGIKINDLESESGVLVTHVIEDTPADRAGVLEGDVILAIDDEQISSSQQLVSYVHGLQADDMIVIDLRRNGRHLQLEATLTEYKPKREIEIRKI